MNRLCRSLRPHRGLLLVLTLLAFLAGWLVANHLQGEPRADVWALGVLLGLAWVGDRLHEALRRNGTIDLLERVALSGDDR